MWLHHHLRQDIEAAAMRHAEDNVLNPERATALDNLFQPRDQRFAAVEPKALGAGIFDV
jgi:hypothetical protein